MTILSLTPNSHLGEQIKARGARKIAPSDLWLAERFAYPNFLISRHIKWVNFRENIWVFHQDERNCGHCIRLSIGWVPITFIFWFITIIICLKFSYRVSWPPRPLSSKLAYGSRPLSPPVAFPPAKVPRAVSGGYASKIALPSYQNSSDSGYSDWQRSASRWENTGRSQHSSLGYDFRFY